MQSLKPPVSLFLSGKPSAAGEGNTWPILSRKARSQESRSILRTCRAKQEAVQEPLRFWEISSEGGCIHLGLGIVWFRSL